MKIFTVQCEYPALHRAEVTVEAEDAVGACRAAIDVANQSDAWKSLDWEQPSYVVALTLGEGIDPWRRTPEGADASVLPVPGLFTDVATLAATPPRGARTWFSSFASSSMPSVTMAGCGSIRRRWCACAPRVGPSCRMSIGAD